MAGTETTASTSYVSPYAKFGKIGYIMEVLRLPLCITASVAGFTVGFIIIHMAEPGMTFWQLVEKYFWQLVLGIWILLIIFGHKNLASRTIFCN